MENGAIIVINWVFVQIENGAISTQIYPNYPNLPNKKVLKFFYNYAIVLILLIPKRRKHGRQITSTIAVP